jgi:glucan phosphoethanolaminetransferase (alkaline phosphatase superfamily)
MKDLKQFKVIEFLKGRVHFKQWEIAKYFVIAVVMFSPALLSFFHHIENQYYVRLDNLLSFLAFSFSAFAILIIFRVRMIWTTPFILFAVGCVGYHLTMGKPIGFQTMAAMYETNLTETLGFLSSPYSIPMILGGGAFASVVIWYILRKEPLFGLRKETHIRRYYLLILMLLATLLFVADGKSILFTYPIDIFYTNHLYFKEKRLSKKYCKTAYDFNVSDNPKYNSNDDELFVLIIGEAARRTALQPYGEKEETTPCLNKFIKGHPKNIVLFSNAISGSAYTRGSVPTLLSTFDLKDIKHLLDRPSLTKMFNGADCRTLYVTTRPRYTFPNIVSIFQDDARQYTYLTSIKHKGYDLETLPVIEKFIAANRGKKKFIILHLMGSHIKYSMQYPKNEKFFNSGNKMIDSYNDSIRYSDKVIQKVVDIVMEYKKPAIILYASDHGENLDDYGDGNYGHGTRELTRFEFEIPFMLYFNNSFLKTYSEQCNAITSQRDVPINQDMISHTLLGLAGIWDKQYYRAAEDLSSPKFNKNHTRYVIDEHMNVYDYKKLNLYKKEVKNKR